MWENIKLGAQVLVITVVSSAAWVVIGSIGLLGLGLIGNVLGLSNHYDPCTDMKELSLCDDERVTCNDELKQQLEDATSMCADKYWDRLP
jgi:hypothetical protein